MPTQPPKSQGSFTASPARREAFRILIEVDRTQSHSDELLRSARVSALSPADRHLCTTLVLGVLRWQILLDAKIAALLAKPNARLDLEVRTALRLGAFQILFLARVPAHAAIDESVSLTKLAGHTFAAGMVNAVLRKLKSQPVEDLTTAELAVSAHPQWMVERWAARYGLAAAEAICLHGQQQPILSLRLTTPSSENDLITEGIVLEPGTILTAARTVVSGDITATAACREGHVRLQEEGSQLVAELAGQGSNILDACAAPGGKTMILAERNPTAKIVACDISPQRLGVLRHRLAATPFAGQIELREADATQLPATADFDLILADVPCSGTGTMGRNPEIRHRLQPADLARHHQRQCAILRAALNAGRHRVLYSTCSLEPEENEAVITGVLGETSGWKCISLEAQIDALQAQNRLTDRRAELIRDSLDAAGTLHLLPGKFNTDGFFIAMLERA